MRAAFIAALLSVGLLLFAACSSDSSGSGDISMTPSQLFEPVEFTVRAGEIVQWSNDSPEAHTVTAYDDGVPEGAAYFASGDFGSESAARRDISEGLIAPGDTFEVTFDEPGTYEYFCIPHESGDMKGTVIVRP